MTAVIKQSEFWEIWNRKIEYFAVENVHRNNGLTVCMMPFGALSINEGAWWAVSGEGVGGLKGL